MRTVINLHSGPGAGKSTTAAGLFHLLKLAKIPCELVLEYAKDMTYSQRQSEMSDQIYIFSKQNKRIEDIHRYDPKIMVITDSPIRLGTFYGQNLPYIKELELLIEKVYSTRNNIDIFVNRVKDYNPSGRNQSLEEAQYIDSYFLNKYKFDLVIDGDENAAEKIFNYINYV